MYISRFNVQEEKFSKLNHDQFPEKSSDLFNSCDNTFLNKSKEENIHEGKFSKLMLNF